MYYDHKQLDQDLRMIARAFGSYQSVGSFTKLCYECGIYRIVDSFIEPHVYVLGQQTPKQRIAMSSPVAQFVLNQAIRAEDLGYAGR